MASKFGLAGGIPERRVRPIWDAVDSRQYKAALKLCVSLLAKYRNSPYALALKALILERMGKSDEALGVCLTAKDFLDSDNAPFLDDLTLSTLQIVFQRLDRLDLATSCYEYACTKYPNNLEIMMGLFNCYVREYSYVKQQQTAIKMYKTVGEERFLLWAVCSIQLQVHFSSGGEKLLPLSEALLKKHINSHSLHEPEALLIYISILEQQRKYESALEVISSDLGSLIGREDDKLRMQGVLLSRACNYSAAAEIFQKVLESCPDDWDLFLHYLSCMLEEDLNWYKEISANPYSSNCQKVEGSNLSKEMFDSRLSSAQSFVRKLQKNSIEQSARGPHLADVEIQRRFRLNGKSDDSEFTDSLVNYFDRFGHLSCFASDVETYLHMLNEKERAELLERILALPESPSSSPTMTLGRAITVFRVKEICASMFKNPVEGLEEYARKMVELFCRILPLSRDLDAQENMHGEEILSMASSCLVMLYWRTRNLGYLLESILILEFGLNLRRYVSQYKIPLIHLYSYFGALPLACDWYVTLDVKNILLETVSHHIVPQMLNSPFLQECLDLVKEYLNFMDDHLKDSADLTCVAYRHRNYTKAIEFVRFKDRLQHSSQYLMTRLNSLILELKQKADSPEQVEHALESVNYGTKTLDMSSEEKLKYLTFNEDLHSRPWWSPTPTLNFLSEQFNEESASLCFSTKRKISNEKVGPGDKKEIERKSLIPRLIYLSMESVSSTLKASTETNGTVCSSSKVGELKILLERYASCIGFSSFDDSISAILSVSTGQKSFEDMSDPVSFLTFAVFLNAWNSSCSNSVITEQSSKISWETLDTLIKTFIDDQLDKVGPTLTNPGYVIPVLVQLLTEPISWQILIIQYCLRSNLVPHGKKKKKGGLNDKSNPNPNPMSRAMQSSVQCLIDSIGVLCKWLTGQLSGSEESNLDILLSYLVKNEDNHGPGRVLQVLEENSKSMAKSEVGERIYESVKSWECPSVVRKIIGAKHMLLSEFGKICDSKLKLLESLKQSC